MPDLLSIIPATVPADDAGGENAIAAVASSDAFPSGQFRLHLLEFFRRNDGLVIRFHIVLGNLAFIHLVLLRQEIHGECLLQQGIAFVFLVCQYTIIEDYSQTNGVKTK